MFVKFKSLFKNFDKVINSAKALENLDEKTHSKLICRFEDLFAELDQVLHQYLFKTSKEEVKFFKVILPNLLYSYWLLHIQFEMRHVKPIYTEEVVPFYKDMVKRLLNFKHTHVFLYRYYKSEKKNRDIEYFDNIDTANFTCLATDHNSYYVAYFRVIDEVVISIQETLMFYANEPLNIPKLEWTNTATSLAVLIYGLKKCGYVNYGKVTIKELCIGFEQVFNTSLQKQVHSLMHEHANKKNTETSIFIEMNNKLMK
ncbi:MAG: RteC domain-containing protein [Flavobacteriaceae bacterium]|jgi:hypothetical protein|nr:RteC domain-containing protein [Flavobacteriaceae bacterium]